jgi:hypothetical protein
MGTQEKQLGNSKIKWKNNPDGTFSGVVISNGKAGEQLHDDDEHRLITRLQNEAGTLEPNYFGMDGAIARFLEFMPGGFEGEQNLKNERKYKLRAHEELNEVLTVGQAGEATVDDAARLRDAPVWINILSQFESMHLKDCIEGPLGVKFLRSAAQFAGGDVNAASAAMQQAMKLHGPMSWPIATYFPFLWEPERHMFLKPMVTLDYAQRIGHPFQYVYEPDISREVYDSLLELAQSTKQAIEHLNPRDNIDVQSFIWVVGAYTDADKPD